MIRVSALPPQEALAFWQQRVPITADEFSALETSAQKRTFTVAGVTRQELVGAVHQSLHEALQQGTSLQEWRKQAHAILSKDSDSPAGVLKPHRLDTIYRTNLQTAYQAGRWTQQQAVAEDRPYLRYSAIRDRRTRPEHATLHGMVYPADHAFWDQYYPPNGFNCRCTVVSLSERDVERNQLEVREDIPGPQEWADPVTGEVKHVLPAPDPGFGRNAGKDWLTGLSPSELDKAPIALPVKTLCRNGRGLFAGEDCKVPLKDIEPRHIYAVEDGDILPAGLQPEEYVHAFMREAGLRGINDSRLLRLSGVELPLVISKGLFIDKRTGAWKVLKSGRERYMRLLARTIMSPYEVWMVPAEVTGKPMPVVRLLRLFSTGHERIGGFAVFNLVQGRRWSAATTFTPKTGDEAAMLKYLEKQRQGTLLFREK